MPVPAARGLIYEGVPQLEGVAIIDVKSGVEVHALQKNKNTASARRCIARVRLCLIDSLEEWDLDEGESGVDVGEVVVTTDNKGSGWIHVFGLLVEELASQSTIMNMRGKYNSKSIIIARNTNDW